MNAPDDPRPDDPALDAAWRALREDTAPSPAVRAAILAEAGRAARAAHDGSGGAGPGGAGPGGRRIAGRQRAANDAHWKPKALAAVALLGLLALVAQQALRWRPAVAPDAASQSAPLAVTEGGPPAAPQSVPPLAAAPADTGWAADTEAFLRDLIERRGGTAGAVAVHCDAARCELAGDASLLQGVVHAPELARRLRLAGDAERASAPAEPGALEATAARVRRAASAERADAAASPAGPPAAREAAGPTPGVVRYTLERVTVP